MLRFSPNSNLAHLIRWFEWEDDAFQKARQEDKPVMLFLSAFWCRYCQRMDEGALSGRENRALLNAYFIALRAEDAMRPDIDARYNLNGWPTIAFFTPAGQLLAASNFLPIEDFKNLLLNVYLAYQDKNTESPEAQTGAAFPKHSAKEPEQEILSAITQSIMALADPVNGGYGRGQKFIQAPANDFLLCRYEATRNPAYLDHVRLTLDRMREGQIHDVEEGGYFRTTTGADWLQPHREKLLIEQAGLLSNVLRVFRLTGRHEYAGMAEEIVAYLNDKLFDPKTGAFFGCEDFLRRETAEAAADGDFFSIIDECIYTDANAVAAVAYLEAATVLGRADCRERALNLLDFLWSHCRNVEEGMYHYHDGAPRLAGLLLDQALIGIAMLDAYSMSAEAKYLERAQINAECILQRLKNSDGGFYDRKARELGFLKFSLTDLDQNGAAAIFFLRLAGAAGEPLYRESALWALRAAGGDVAPLGIHAARFGRALSEFLQS
ncbi:MAG TPA: DUF255 domain-containing protein [Candidatus Binatia bacterium]|nr:DUF255 domain-containing protein [Candidatus Binatia bacterium]